MTSTGLTPKQALALGLKVDVAAVPRTLLEVLKAASVSLEKPETTLVLLRANAVVGVTESCVSQHLRVLRALRLVKSRRAGKFVYYSLDDAHITLLLQTGLTHQGHGDAQDHAQILGKPAAGADRDGFAAEA